VLCLSAYFGWFSYTPIGLAPEVNFPLCRRCFAGVQHHCRLSNQKTIFYIYPFDVFVVAKKHF
jgi:hypothetical protein